LGGQPGLIISPLFGLITFVGRVEADQIGIGCGADKILEMFYWGELVQQTVTIEPQFSHVAPPLQ
jgi:histidinol-phosphate/aromatic aminotransferase/cobyric acid decarboxylase-like protein